MENWQKLIQVLVEIWTDEDIKNESWKRDCEHFESRNQPSEEQFDGTKQIKESA